MATKTVAGRDTPAHPTNGCAPLDAKLGEASEGLAKAAALLDLLCWIEGARDVTKNVAEAAQLSDDMREKLTGYDIPTTGIGFEADASKGLIWILGDLSELVHGASSAIDQVPCASKGGAR